MVQRVGEDLQRLGARSMNAHQRRKAQRARMGGRRVRYTMTSRPIALERLEPREEWRWLDPRWTGVDLARPGSERYVVILHAPDGTMTILRDGKPPDPPSYTLHAEP